MENNNPNFNNNATDPSQYHENNNLNETPNLNSPEAGDEAGSSVANMNLFSTPCTEGNVSFAGDADFNVFSTQSAAPSENINKIPGDTWREYLIRLLLCLTYAVVFTFCLYKNENGITYPVFSAATIGGFILFLKATGEKIKKLSYLLMTFIMALSIHVCTTTSVPLVIFDKLFVFALFFIMFLYNLYDDSTWDVSRYFFAILGTLLSSLRFVVDPLADAFGLKKDDSENPGSKIKENILPVIIGLAITVPLLCVILPLLASSDAVFSNVLDSIFSFDINEDFINIIFITFFIFLFGYMLIKRFYHKSDWLTKDVTDKRTHNPMVAITISAVLLIFYVIYSGIQIIYLFLGFGELPKGYTYAEYAHEGFFQLVFVCLINLALVLICRKYSKDNKVLKIMLTTICACTYVMLLSSAYRMILYISVYGLTFLRVYVLWALIVIALVMAGTIAYIFFENMPFVRYSALVVVITWSVFAFSYPDRYIASYNLENSLDQRYVACSLSYDAAPVVAQHRASLEKEGVHDDHNLWTHYRSRNENHSSHDNDFRKFNFSEYNARQYMR